MKKFLTMALVVLAMSFASCGRTTTTDETLDASVDSTEVVVDSVSVDTVAVDTVVENVKTL